MKRVRGPLADFRIFVQQGLCASSALGSATVIKIRKTGALQGGKSIGGKLRMNSKAKVKVIQLPFPSLRFLSFFNHTLHAALPFP
jgi:hypothetical protein